MLNNIIIRLVIYYLAWLLILNAIFHLFPEILYYVAMEGKLAVYHWSIDEK